MGDLFAAYEEVVGDAVEGLVGGFRFVGGNGLHGEQTAHSEFLSIFQGQHDIRGVVDGVTLGGHAALGTVDGVVEVVTGEDDGEIDPIRNRIAGGGIILAGAGLKADRFRELGIRGGVWISSWLAGMGRSDQLPRASGSFMLTAEGIIVPDCGRK